MVDHEGYADALEHVLQLDDIGGIEVQHDVPAHGFDALEHAIEYTHVGCAAQVLDEVEAHTAHAAFMQGIEALAVDMVVDDGDTAITALATTDCVDHGGVVGAMTAGLHDHAALEAKEIVQRDQVFERRVRRRIAR